MFYIMSNTGTIMCYGRATFLSVCMFTTLNRVYLYRAAVS